MHKVNFVTICLLLVVFPIAGWAQPRFPISKDKPSPIDGIVITEKRALENAKEKIELKELRNTHAIDSRTWAFKENKYEEGLKERDKKIEEMNNFWQRNKFEFGVVGGFILGVGITIAIVKSVKSL